RRTTTPTAKGQGRARAQWPRDSLRRSRRSPRPRRKRREMSRRLRQRARARDPTCGGYSAHMADFRPVEAVKGHILMIRPAPAGTPIDDANIEWVEIIADLSSDFANWPLQPLHALWKPDGAKPVEWEWIYTWGSPCFVRAGEIYRIHSGSRARAAMHPVPDDLAPGRKHVYAAG